MAGPTESALRAAKESGEVLTVKYHGGSRPGAVRQILPVSFSGDKVRARCLTSNATKLFRMDKIEIVDSTEEPDWGSRPPETPKPEFKNVEDVCTKYRGDLEGLGWTVVTEGEAFALFRCYKNGRRLKWPTVSLCYEEEYLAECYIDLDGSEHDDIKPRVRPWIVRGKGGRHVAAYKTLDRAAATFMEQARLQAPNPATANREGREPLHGADSR